MNKTYQFDQFKAEQQQDEINRLTANVGSHAKDICGIFLAHGLLDAEQVLDVGCGTGSMIGLLSDILPKTKFVGIDSSQTMIEQANKQFSSSQVEWIEGEAHRLPFADNSFDFVYTRLVLLHNQYPHDILQEMKRVCKTGGVVVCVEIDDGTMVFHPYSRELEKLIQAYIDYSAVKGMDRLMGRKLYPLYKNTGFEKVKIIVQNSDYSGAFEDIPFPIKLALGADEGKVLVEAGFLSEEERIDILHKIKLFTADEHRFYTGSFMYAIGEKKEK